MLTRSGTFRLALAAALVGAALAAYGQLSATVIFIAVNLLAVAPLLVPGILLAAWVVASGFGSRTGNFFSGRQLTAIFLASLIGAVTPVCGVTVLPLMVAFLSAGVPFAPVMAFWLSSPVTDPVMIAATAATLGTGFAVGKTIAAFGLGICGGLSVMALAKFPLATEPLRNSRFLRDLIDRGKCRPDQFTARIWQHRQRREMFRLEVVSILRLVLLCLIPAFAAEHLLGILLKPDALAAYVGETSGWAVPLAVVVGAPAYIDGLAALPLARGLMNHGASAGAAMAFLVAGGVISIWGAVAIFPALRISAFLLYLAVAIAGSLATGWIYGFAVS
ncbi:MAG: permease [Rhodobacteraceae bacterium]|nr:permease [Paracoccaceae bacterium]